MSNNKERLDVLLVKKGYFSTREKAKRTIMSGDVLVSGEVMDKAGAKVNIDSVIQIKEKPKYVSRGGLKLEKALQVFDIVVDGKIFMDAGASTGGFTDCLLQNGAKKVYSIDVGYGQFDWQLRNDPRVVLMERTNIRYIDNISFDDEINGAVVDVSFISLKKVLPAVVKTLSKNSDIVVLIKPQFEAGRKLVGKNGVVRDLGTHKNVINDLLSFFEFDLSLSIEGVDFSPVTGPKGNIEYLAYLKKQSTQVGIDKENIVNEVVLGSHKALKKT